MVGDTRQRALATHLPLAEWGLLAVGVALFLGLYVAGAWCFSVSVASLFWVALVIAFFCLHQTLPALVVLVAAMLFSPEVQVAPGVIVRIEDVMTPFIGLGLIARQMVGRHALVWRRAWPDGFLLAVLAVHAASSVAGAWDGRVESTTAVLWNLKVAEMFAIYWITLNLLRSPRDVRLLLGAGCLVFIAVAIYAAMDIPVTELYSAQRLTMPFEDTPEPTTLGGYLTLVSGVVMAIALYETSPRRKALWWTLAAVCVIPVLYTFSRTTYVSYAVVVFCLGILARRVWLLVVLALALLVCYAWGPSVVIERVASTFDVTREHGLDPSLWERIDVWNKVKFNLGLYPLLGRGFPQPILDSQFARILIESGVLGCLAWLGLLGACARVGVRLFRHTQVPLHKGLALGYLVAVAGILVHATASITFLIVRIMQPFWLLTGIVVFLDLYERGRLPAATADRPGEATPACAESAE